jgi:hypothetical protein
MGIDIAMRGVAVVAAFEALGDDVKFRRSFAAGGGFGVFDGGEIAFQHVQQLFVRAASEYFGDECAALNQILHRKVGRGFCQADGTQMVRLRMAHRVGRHVGDDKVRSGSQGL